jgi:hypothetical protein
MLPHQRQGIDQEPGVFLGIQPVHHDHPPAGGQAVGGGKRHLRARIEIIKVDQVGQHRDLARRQSVLDEVGADRLGIGHHAHGSTVGAAHQRQLPRGVDLAEIAAAGDQLDPRPPGGELAENRRVRIPRMQDVDRLLPQPPGQATEFNQGGGPRQMANGDFVDGAARGLHGIQQEPPPMEHGHAMGKALPGQAHRYLRALAFRAAADQVVDQMDHAGRTHGRQA